MAEEEKKSKRYGIVLKGPSKLIIKTDVYRNIEALMQHLNAMRTSPCFVIFDQGSSNGRTAFDPSDVVSVFDIDEEEQERQEALARKQALQGGGGPFPFGRG